MQEVGRVDDKFFAGLVQEHQASLRAFVRSLGVDSGWVDDLAQDAFVTAYQYYEPEIRAETQPVEIEVAKAATLD